MARNFKIELEEEVFLQLKEICKGDENAIRDYVAQTLKEKLSPINSKDSSEEKDSLESYLKKAQSGSRNYGVKGQGW
ncbi:MAG: hypothetical protein F3744_00695 [Nitrospinae bacterium]|nr:hypothetical protein [Nitrospinota bacterium]